MFDVGIVNDKSIEVNQRIRGLFGCRGQEVSDMSGRTLITLHNNLKCLKLLCSVMGTDLTHSFSSPSSRNNISFTQSHGHISSKRQRSLSSDLPIEAIQAEVTRDLRKISKSYHIYTVIKNI